MAPILEIEELHVSYGNVNALRGVSIRIGMSEIVSVIGSNGAGKTTLLSAIAGVAPVVRGEIRFEGSSVLGRKPEAIANGGIRLVPEGREIFASLTVGENLVLGLPGGKATANPNSSPEIGEILEFFPILKERLGARAGTLSGGEQQQLAVARALLGKPSLLMVDEPSLGLAPRVVTAIFEELLRLREGGLTVLLVEQQAKRAAALADRTYVLNHGQVVQELSKGDELDTRELGHTYLAGGD